MTDYSHLKDLPFTKLNYKDYPIVTSTRSVVLKDGSVATLHPVNDVDQLPKSLIKFMNEVFNQEVIKGDTYPHHEILDFESFKDYWFHYFVAILVNGESELNEDVDWKTQFLGTYYIKPNYIGRCSHVCNAGFIVNPNTRGKGIGKELGKSYLVWASQLGYIYSVFNLVFETNVASWKLWDSLGFERIGYVKNVAILEVSDKPVGAIIFGKDL